MRRIQKLSFLLLLLCLLLVLTGCAYKSVDKRSFIVSVGVDPSDDPSKNFKVTLKVAKPIPSLQQAQTTEYAYLIEESETVAQAVRFLETHNDKVLDFSQAKTLAIHEDLLEEDMQHFMDYFTRRGDIQLIMYVAAAHPSAEEVLKVEPELESAGENSLYNFFDKTGTESPFIVTCFLFEFRRDFKVIGKSAVLPLIKASADGEELIINTSLVVKDKEPPIEMSPKQTKIFNTLMKQANGYGYQIDNKGYVFTLTFDRVRLKYKLHTEKGKTPRADIHVKAVGSINESNKTLYLKKINTYNQVINDQLSNELEALLRKLQENGTDPFGFGLRYRATHLHTDRTASDWKNIYPDLEFNVKVDTNLKSLGAIQ